MLHILQHYWAHNSSPQTGSQLATTTEPTWKMRRMVKPVEMREEPSWFSVPVKKTEKPSTTSKICTREEGQGETSKADKLAWGAITRGPEDFCAPAAR